ncbi:small s [Fusarium beomiforme]|uniref:Small s n=1 Tax=Fusarium beomiforme TaxID=44412 RepID=A0A9P5DY09_9HYPO|nr:small s [Fusarium beomiforme]
MKALSQSLKPPVQVSISSEQRALHDLALKCHELSQKILDLLDKIRPNRKTLFEDYKSAYRAWSCENNIKALEKQLNDCRTQNDASRLEKLQRHVEFLNKGMSVKDIGDEATTQLLRVLGLQDEALASIYQQRILDSIRFESVHERDERVLYPHEKTFDWLVKDQEMFEPEKEGLSESEANGMYEMKSKARSIFLNWLSSSEGIFHISGKLGSGKSTLMKLLCTHQNTQVELQKWAGDTPLLVSRFFFWKPGFDMQKSLNGLYRSLLYDMLNAYPHIISKALPDHWKEVKESPWQVQTKLHFSIDVAKAALERIIFNNDSCAPNIRFCFFIDGLDEYEDTHSKDQTYLVSMLKGWVKNSRGRLKMVVSSRDYNVFLNGFSAKYRLQLHELTWFDMRRYVRDSLSHFHNSKLQEQLEIVIPKKASGIFLWIVLVVNEIRKKIEDEVSEKQLLRLLDSLPPGLEALFQHILNKLDEGSRRTSYQTMSLLRTAKENYLTFALMEFSFLEDYQRDRDFSTQENFMSYHATDIDENRTPEIYVKRLRGICGGLVECHKSTARYYGDWGGLSFAHRSIPEMLERGKMKSEMQSSLQGFNTIDALSHLIFAAAQFRKNKSEARPSCAGVTWMRLAARVDKPPYRFLQCISSWAGDPFDAKPEPSHLLLQQGIHVFANHGLESLVRYGAITRRETFSTLCQAALIGHVDYIEWQFRNNSQAVDKPWKRTLIAHALLDTYLRDGRLIQKLSYFYESVFASLERTYFEANLMFDTSSPVDGRPDTASQPRVELEKSHPVDGPSSTGPSYALSDNLTVWERFLVSCFMGWIGLKFPFHADRFGLAVEQFLLHGAPSGFLVTIEHLAPPPTVAFHFPRPKGPLTIECQDYDGVLVEKLTGWNERDGKPIMSLRGRQASSGILFSAEFYVP